MVEASEVGRRFGIKPGEGLKDVRTISDFAPVDPVEIVFDPDLLASREQLIVALITLRYKLFEADYPFALSQPDTTPGEEDEDEGEDEGQTGLPSADAILRADGTGFIKLVSGDFLLRTGVRSKIKLISGDDLLRVGTTDKILRVEI